MLHMNGSAKNQTKKGCIYAGDEGIQQQYPYEYRCREGLRMVLLLNAIIPCLHAYVKEEEKEEKQENSGLDISVYHCSSVFYL